MGEMRVLVTAASRHGATAEIAHAICRALGDYQVEAELQEPALVESLDRFDAVILGSAVYYGKWMPEAIAFVDRHRAALRERPLWMFSSGPLGAPDLKPEGEPPEVAQLARELAAREHRIFAGELERGELGLAERAVVRVVGAQAGDFRDWATVTTWAKGIAHDLKPELVVPA
jgi:menaquinone-dependent protoporphyrinogen oxidase